MEVCGRCEACCGVPACGPGTKHTMAKKSDEVKVKKSPLGVLLRLAVAGAAVYFVVSLVSGQLQVAEKQRELEALQARVSLQTEKNEELMRMLDADNDDAYIERMAREKLGYAKPGELVFVDLTGE